MPKIYCLIWPGLTDKMYTGKTSRSLAVRLREHMTPRRWSGALGKALAKYGRPEIRLLEECAAEEVNARERYWIEQLSRVPAGYNVSVGGDGGSMPEQVRKQISESSLRFWQSTEGRALARKRGLEVWSDPEKKKARVQAMQCPERKQKQREKALEYGARPEVKAELRRKVLARFEVPGHGQTHGEAVRKGMADPEARARYESRLTPEAKRKIRDGNIASWQDPALREKRLANMKKAREDPEVRAKLSAAKKAYWEEWRRLKSLKSKEKHEALHRT